MAEIKARRSGQAISAVSVSVYSEIVSNAIAMTKEWPGIVWEAIVSTLEKAQMSEVDSQDLNAIVDVYAWKINQKPFTLAYIDPKPFSESVQRAVGRYGLKTLASLDNGLSLAAAAGQSGVMNTAWQERERIGLAIAEYMIALRQSASSTVSIRPKPFYVKREAGKLKTDDRHASWEKKYRQLKRSKPGKIGAWYAKEIAKLDIAQGRKYSTILRNMKK